jgi:acylphosphatase
MAGQTRREVAFFGRVQGVGFRFSAHSLARGFDITGYVRNMPDGSVQLVAEGPGEEVEGFIAALKARMAGYIKSADEEEAQPTGSYGSFEITF